ncbi:MAG: HU family DNA-binding protein, partial [Bryobacterales bacterium]|nr:HU family DNA-binding protein [Bryobacterales bacterium]
MTKAELVSEVVNSTNTTRQEADVVVDTVLDSIVSSLTKG